MGTEYLVLSAGLAALLLSLVVWADARRIKRRAAAIIAWHEQQQHTVEHGGMVISVEVNRQPAPTHLHLQTMQVVGANHGVQQGGPPNLN